MKIVSDVYPMEIAYFQSEEEACRFAQKKGVKHEEFEFPVLIDGIEYWAAVRYSIK